MIISFHNRKSIITILKHLLFYYFYTPLRIHVNNILPIPPAGSVAILVYQTITKRLTQPLCLFPPSPLCSFTSLLLCLFAPLPLSSFASLLLRLFPPSPLCSFASLLLCSFASLLLTPARLLAPLLF
ncbi:hypothetical protein SAMN04487893_10474 [Myroides guanonis]|uniref:Uncharacterized protein n=1 Tax=Myroides guanonis TaxID=1150112 RepID=A0A1I3PDI3_9FLAO|nr:hypothetical protein SAMN04487893_10474 [Myroides guanonis]